MNKDFIEHKNWCEDLYRFEAIVGITWKYKSGSREGFMTVGGIPKAGFGI